ncbi:hypothetical protein COY93_00625 [Candidatus Uhrbacteria bacterium CG_4_10_14_0_8_um_filter_58_22]|uniref:Amidoligase enzyme n=1 Tax=Candidatus Uhrbacteria bacterium CG_4_10_14_0_8_um_filter_58_22 TaxID=1975029 RepID=A0A2M7QBY2_9BACT|nr:MAG: hypothetical protein AUJ19_04170 [Parcubacteria group bacterium CG1_02_58_44]PIY63291.1 MAG: hypothetical protein COY93_00625 [Candidatus Uhrbacteria bacterium CG_4_10_14_0_8_um_filter_58_22]
MSEKDRFLGRFGFRPEGAGRVGVEREFFLMGPAATITGEPNPGSSVVSADTACPVPWAERFLSAVSGGDGRGEGPAHRGWTHELSACQVEHRTDAHDMSALTGLSALNNDLFGGLVLGSRTAEALGGSLEAMSVAPEGMTLEVFPDERHTRIAAALPRGMLEAACRVAGVHIHLGVADIESAIRLHDLLVGHLDELMRLGDLSGGQRMELYCRMAENWRPQRYGSTDRLFKTAVEQGFVDNPRDCYHLIRISVHGTVELRMFDATGNCDDIIGWVLRLRGMIAAA